MISKLHIENFKSLIDFDLPSEDHRLTYFTCLIGLNGSGKSTLLQAFDFISNLVVGKIDEWLNRRDWKASELTSNVGKRSPVITFRITVNDEKNGEITWHGRFNYNQLRCTYEKIESGGKSLLELNEGQIKVAGEDGEMRSKFEKLDLVYQGSILSILKLSDAHPKIDIVKTNLLNLKSLELLSPDKLRRRAKSAADIGVGGEKLSAFLNALSSDHKTLLLENLKLFYPQIERWQINTLRAGWKNLRVWENYGKFFKVDAAHLNDGLLRIMAILSQAYSSHSFLLFDEIENGVNPELVEKLVDFLIQLKKLKKQVIVTTHSPMILNYIPDDVAKESVILLYKTKEGATKSKRFFDIPRLENKLRALGPGEVFVDTPLTEIVQRLSKQDINSESSNADV